MESLSAPGQRARQIALGMILRILAVVGGIEVLAAVVLEWLDIPGMMWRIVVDAGVLISLAALPLYMWVTGAMAQHLSAEAVLDLVQGLEVIVWEADPATSGFSFVSQGAKKVLGYPAEQWLGKPDFWINLIHPDDRKQVAATWRAVAAEGRDEEFEFRAVAADGRVVWVRNIVRVVRDGRGRVQRMRGVMVDITAQKTAEEALREISEKVRTLLEAMPDAVFFKDGQGRWLLANSAGLRPFNLEDVPYRGKTDLELAELRPEYRDAFLACVRTDEQAWQRGTVSVDEERIARSDGSTAIFETIKVPLFNHDGSRKGLVIVGRDITDRRKAEESRNQLVAILEATTDFVATADPEGRVLYYNGAARRMLGIGEDEDISHITIPQTRPVWARERIVGEGIPAAIRDGVWRGETAFLSRDGREIPVSQVILAHRTADGAVAYLSTIARDISDRKRAEAALRESEERFRNAFENAPVGMALKGVDGRYLRVNGALCQMLGYSEQELLATTFLDIVHPDDLSLTREGMRQLLSGEVRVLQDEKRYVHKLGHTVWAQMSVSLVRDDGGNPLYFVSQAQDITERKRFEAQLVQLAERDPLTGLFNRRRFQEELERELARARRYGTHGAVLFLDLDDFKDVNDSFGHRAGDRLLKSVASVLRARLRETDTLARIGGDEFAILLPRTDVHQTQVVARHILEAVRRHAVTVGGQRVAITASVGIALYPQHGTAVQQLLARADLAMYQAKESGQDGLCVYSPEPGGQAQIASRLTWKRRVREALEKNRLLLYCQPILDLRTNQVTQYELLVRMVGDGGEVISPRAFLGVAERFGLVHLIDHWVVRQAILLIADQQRAGRAVHLSVNLSGKAFTDAELLPLIRRELAESAINPARLVLEITETAAVADVEQAWKFIDALRELGCRFALDDFGVGFSSFSHLKHLPVDYLKIDGGFIRNLPRDEVDQHLVRAVVGVARGLGKRTVAEFVGDEETVRLLREYGVDYAQGYHIGRPRPVSEVFSGVTEETGREASRVSPRGGRAVSRRPRRGRGDGEDVAEQAPAVDPAGAAAREAAAGREPS